MKCAREARAEKKRKKVVPRIVDFWDAFILFCYIVGVYVIGIINESCWGIALWSDIVFIVLAVLICVAITGFVITRIEYAYLIGRQDMINEVKSRLERNEFNSMRDSL